MHDNEADVFLRTQRPDFNRFGEKISSPDNCYQKFVENNHHGRVTTVKECALNIPVMKIYIRNK